MSGIDAVFNLGSKAARRLQSAHKPFVRLMRRQARAQEHREFRRQAVAVEREIARVAAGTGPIIAGPWLAEVGYEVLYWIPFLRWLQDAYAVAPERIVVLSRGGIGPLYRGIAGSYVEIFDLISPGVLAARNAERQSANEGGGQKQSGMSALDEELIGGARGRLGLDAANVCHPSLMFRLFRHVWHGNLPLDYFWTRTRFALTSIEAHPQGGELPREYIAAKLYTGPAMTMSESTRTAVRALVAQAATIAPVVALETQLGLDEHRDFDLAGIPGVISARDMMAPGTNLGVQASLIAGSKFFLGTCGGLAWLAPFLGVPTVAVLDNDQLLAPHLMIARQAGRAVGAAEFTPLDLRAVRRIGMTGAPLNGAGPVG